MRARQSNATVCMRLHKQCSTHCAEVQVDMIAKKGENISIMRDVSGTRNEAHAS